ncbi:MAG: pyruvate dehydrogenase kinase 2/3/4 [Candidatus Sumerlaeota bacterium]|nr:pyruvate dehydrogenase kinase 2/3/4 [Candidatus Sumerlaeota bacterium]
MDDLGIPKRVADEIRVYANRKQTPLTIRQLYEFGVSNTVEMRLKAAKFLHCEIPVRLAHMARNLESLPFGLSETPSVRRIRQLYIDSFKHMIDFPHPLTESDEVAFTNLIDTMKNRHANVVPTMARGLRELQEIHPREVEGEQIRHFLDRFYMSRIGIRMLIGQHIALHEERTDDWVGIIYPHTSPAEVAKVAAQQACDLCRVNYGTAPRVEIAGRTDLEFTYIPTHLHHMIFELIKNSLRATVEVHGEDGPLPDVKIIVAGGSGSEDVTIKIADEGGGIPRSGVNRIWTYLYSTANIPMAMPGGGGEEVVAMAGYGYGLPVTRLYARYFGGDVQVISMEGYGTDAYLYLNRLGTHQEVLPTEATLREDTA